MLGPKPVRQPATDGNENREAEEIRGERQLQNDGICSQISRNRRKRRGNHRRIHVFHEQRRSNYQGNHA